VRAVDFDKDGDLDLFVGGRFDPQTYGAPVSSYLLENKGQNKYDIYPAPFLTNIGMVTDAAWADIDQDGWQDLIVLGEWMPIKIFINKEGKFTDETASYGLSGTLGLWSTLKIADINGDGKMDLLAGNVGHNSFYRSGTRVYLNDFDRNGYADQIFCHKLNDNYYPIVDRDELLAQLPSLKSKILYFKDYGPASITDLFEAESLEAAHILDIQHTATTLFLNIGGKFIPQELPAEIQYSNVSAIQVLDVDKDGIMDMLLGGNQYLVKPQFGRQDASLGWLVYGRRTKEGEYGFGAIESLGIEGQIRDFSVLPYKDKFILVTAINNNNVLFHEIP